MFDSIKLYTRSIVNGVSQGLRAATSDFSDGYKSVTAEGELIVAKESKAAAKKAANTTKSPTSEMLQAIKQSGEQVEELQRVVKKHGAGNHSKAFKAGRWMRNPLINTWKFVKNWWNHTTVWKKLEAIAITVGALILIISAAQTVGITPVVTSCVAAWGSIFMSRKLFVDRGHGIMTEWLCDAALYLVMILFLGHSL